MIIEKNHLVEYDINSYNKFILESFEKNQTLPTILRKLKYRVPVLDEIVILAHILNVAKNNLIIIRKGQVKYCFKKYHKASEHGDKVSYLKFLYSLLLTSKYANNSLSRGKRAVSSCKKEQVIQNPIPTIQDLKKPKKEASVTFNSSEALNNQKNKSGDKNGI